MHFCTQIVYANFFLVLLSVRESENRNGVMYEILMLLHACIYKIMRLSQHDLIIIIILSITAAATCWKCV